MKIENSKVHFIGIGGIGMCGLAELLHNMGASVSGSDLSENTQTERLKSLGIQVFKGHKAEQVGDADVVVYSSAVKPTNDEFKEARKLNVPLIARAEALAEVMRLKRGIAVAGTHGKTTTTSLTANVFLEAQKKPTIVVGGRLDLIKATALLGSGEWFIAEADESDGSFMRLSPEVVIITNIDNDHLDHYGSFENLKKTFFDFASKIPFFGVLIACGDDPVIQELFQDFPKKVLLYGFNSENDYVLKGSAGNYEVSFNNNKLIDLQVPMPGKHNALNAIAGVIAGIEAGIQPEIAAAGISSFQGVDRRFQFKQQVNNISVYDDYGHHPTEAKAVLEAFKEKFPDRKLKVLFQPHRFSRTQSCWEDFLNCFKSADELFILDIYPAGESPIEGVTAVALSRQVDHPSCQYIDSKESAVKLLSDELQGDDIFLTLGAGDVWRLGEEIIETLKAKS